MKDFKEKATQITNERFKGSWTVYLGLCKGCLMCIEKCPFAAISPSEKDIGAYGTPSVAVDPQKCTLCQVCEQICPDCALKVEKEP